MSKTLNKFFHFYDRGSTMKREITAGISVFLISVCALFMNIQIMSEAFENNTPYCGLYLGATVVAFIGTLLLGLICNLPLVQTASLSLSTVFISTLGLNTGLTYENLLAVTFVSALVYLVVTMIPGVKKFTLRLLPESVRRALPAVLGLYVIYTALRKMKLVGSDLSLASLSADALGGASIAPYVRMCIITGIIGVAIVLFLKKRHASASAMKGFLIGTIVFYLLAAVGGGIAYTYVFTQNRIWVGINPDPLGEMYTIGLGIKQLNLGAVFSKGFDFAAFIQAGGNVWSLFLQGILTFVFMGMYESEGAVLGADAMEPIIKEANYEVAAGRFLAVNAVINVVAPIFGAAPQSIGKQSVVASNDGGKTGLTSVVCALGYAIAMFTWLPFVIFATYTASVPEYGHAGFVFPNVIKALFQVADGVMLVMGLLMLKSLKQLEIQNFGEFLPFTACIAVGIFTQNIAYGAAVGVIIYTFLRLVSFKKAEIKEITIPNIFMTGLSVILLVLAF